MLKDQWTIPSRKEKEAKRNSRDYSIVGERGPQSDGGSLEMEKAGKGGEIGTLIRRKRSGGFRVLGWEQRMTISPRGKGNWWEEPGVGAKTRAATRSLKADRYFGSFWGDQAEALKMVRVGKRVGKKGGTWRLKQGGGREMGRLQNLEAREQRKSWRKLGYTRECKGGSL